ncbi:molybdate ABC transporter substrate-binding protein [Massilia consociata]|uniref:Molybdate ABC transporter substrate-binding protein n=1 Tax=Massilia consociata TaxID=760117 RepID=A0ABV6FFU3_9BURK
MKKLLVILFATLLSLPASAATLLVAAASDLAYCIDDLAAAFRKEVPGAVVKVSTGASGNFFAQIRNGAPFHVFLSADMMYPTELAKLGAADGATLRPYAVGRIVLWTLDPRLDVGQGLALLRDPRVARVAIGNPDTAPYGRAARAVLERDKLWEAVQPRLVIGENIAQAAQFVQTGNAQLGIVSLATVRAPRMAGVGRYHLIDDKGVAPIEQGAIVTRAGSREALAARFVRFLGSPAARAILERNGFSLPAAAND